MSEYTKDQIDEAKLWLTTNDTGNSYSQKRRIGFEAIILSALDTAEQERDALAARCAELEARLQGAADRAMKWQIKLCEADDWSCENCTECTDLRTAILGEKKE